MRSLGAFTLLILFVGCAPYGRAQYPVSYGGANDATSASGPATPPRIATYPPPSSLAGTKPEDEDPRAARILVLETRALPRPAEVLGVVDSHEATGDEALALRELRENAARLGADAVVGVEFHHAENPGEPLHLSGLAVRFVTLEVER